VLPNNEIQQAPIAYQFSSNYPQKHSIWTHTCCWSNYYVSAVAQSCNCHVQTMHHIQRLLTTELTQTLACTLILPRMDYCNALLLPPASANSVHTEQYSSDRSTGVEEIRHQVNTPPAALVARWTADLQAGCTDVQSSHHFKAVVSETTSQCADSLVVSGCTHQAVHSLRQACFPLFGSSRLELFATLSFWQWFFR